MTSRGLQEKLEYLQWLGVDCLWLLPYYPSPMRDGGYDISNFLSIHPDLGTTDDLVMLLDDAHRRGIRIIADLVMNHTSDEHPWFVESRSSRTNDRADWYVWSDDDKRWPEARVVFVDVETSNWTWDPVRQQFFWHRFYSHQPDLNYDNPDVESAMFGVVRHWLELGLDGFRLDAVSYLYQRDGTTGESLPETHALLRRLRKEVESVNPEAVLLAEANQWPADLVDYFGQSDECQMCFHFPLMPRLFMAVRREQRFPVTEILSQAPPIPPGCQWAIFLRNHDELSLEKVTEEERDYMVAEYAKDPRMQRNMGIGRRLAPLLDGDRGLAELLVALLLSLPGSPVLYYGDELLMGDNVYLGDRDSVRTPMQWSPDRNAGFSKGDFAQLYLPPLMDPVYGFQSVNVEAQQRSPSSFLHWMRRMLQVRKDYLQFGTGGFETVDCANPSVLAYVRTPEAHGRGQVGAKGRQAVAGQPVPAGQRQSPGALRPQSEPFRPAGVARPRAMGGSHPRRAARAGTFPAGDRWADPHDPRAARLLLVRARRGDCDDMLEPRPRTLADPRLRPTSPRRPGWSGDRRPGQVRGRRDARRGPPGNPGRRRRGRRDPRPPAARSQGSG